MLGLPDKLNQHLHVILPVSRLAVIAMMIRRRKVADLLQVYLTVHFRQSITIKYDYECGLHER